jgi:microcystin-dependent protein
MASFVGELRIFTGNFAPAGWAFCNGQVLPVAQYQALFAVLGNMYGGDGIGTFALPDLRDRFPMGAGWGPGLTERVVGEVVGEEAVALATAEMPAHVHDAEPAAPVRATDTSPAGNVFAEADVEQYGPPVQMAQMQALGAAGAAEPHPNVSPWLGLNFIIALQGAFPNP